MDDTLMSEEYEEGEGDSGTSGVLTLDGEAWKNRDNTTYNSVLAEQMFMYQANIQATGTIIRILLINR